jgi:hypothetical protein
MINFYVTCLTDENFHIGVFPSYFQTSFSYAFLIPCMLLVDVPSVSYPSLLGAY